MAATASSASIDAGLDRLKKIQVEGQRFTLEEIAKSCGVTKQAIKHREMVALKKLRTLCSDEMFREFKELV
jgi:DNA-directed RNA polymerase sigma subunit (sigma70/sigma32)